MTSDDERVRAIAREVETYLAEHPDAVDTTAGIAHWWLSRMRVEEAVADVGRALDLLVERGAVVRQRLPDGQCVYGSASGHGR